MSEAKMFYITIVNDGVIIIKDKALTGVYKIKSVELYWNA
jgi:hypothetical protein